MSSKKKKDYKVGYGKPPKDKQFKPGESGNPKGRKKGVKNFHMELSELLNGKIEITENGKTRKVSNRMAALLKLFANAMGGNIRALEKVVELAKEHAAVEQEKSEARQLTRKDEELIEEAMRVMLGIEMSDQAKNPSPGGNDEAGDKSDE